MERRERPYDPFIARMQAKRLFDLGARPSPDKSSEARAEKQSVDWWSRATDFWKGVAIIYLSAIALWVIGYSLYDLFTDFVSKRLVIEPIVIPKILADKGYTPEAAARRLRDALIEIRRYSDGPTEDVDVDMKGGDDVPNISVPGLGVPLESVATLIRAIKRLGYHPTVSGEIVFIDSKLQLHLLKDGEDIQRSVSVSDAERPDKLFEAAAKEFLLQTDPIILSRYLAATQPEKALVIARSIVEYKPESDPVVPKAHDVLGDVLRRYDRKECKGPDQAEYDNRLSKALREYARAIELDPNFAKPYNGMGLVLAEKRDYASARSAFEKAISLAPDFAPPYNNLGVYQRRLEGSKNPAILGAVIANYRKAIELAPQNGVHHYNLGLALYDLQRRDEAMKEFKKAIELVPSYASPHVSLGVALRDHKHLPEAAIDEFDLAIKADRCSALAHYQKGATLHFDQKKFDEATAEYEQAMQIDPNYAAPAYNRGLIFYCNRREVSAAIDSFRQASQLAAKEAWLKFSLGVALEEAGRSDEAIKTIDDAIALNPRKGEFHNFRGEILLARRRIDDARREFVEAIVVDSRGAAAYDNLGKIMRSQRRAKEATGNFRKAVALAPNDWRYHADLGNILQDQGEDAEAEWEFETAFSLLRKSFNAETDRQASGREAVCAWRPRR